MFPGVPGVSAFLFFIFFVMYIESCMPPLTPFPDLKAGQALTCIYLYYFCDDF